MPLLYYGLAFERFVSSLLHFEVVFSPASHSAVLVPLVLVEAVVLVDMVVVRGKPVVEAVVLVDVVVVRG